MQTARPVPPRIDASNTLPLAGLFGTGRCGSTWVGACLASHPEVAYRFEPLHRRHQLGPGGSEPLARLQSGSLTPSELDALYAALLTATPAWEKPPFHPRGYATRLSRGRGVLWPLARRSGVAARLFRWLYTPRATPLVLFKEVDCERAFLSLVEFAQVRLIHLLRHPAAVVHSVVEGQRRGQMPRGRCGVIYAYLEEHAPELLDRLGGPGLSDHGAEALLWRANVERCVRGMQGPTNVRLFFYENVVREPGEALGQMLGHVGLAPHPRVDAFLEETRRPDGRRRRRFVREIGIDPYFSVFRDGVARAFRWQRELDRAARRHIAEVVKESPVFALGSRLAGWDL